MPVQHSTLEDTEIAPGSIAVINLNHVLEHMRNPLDTLLRLHALLEQDGLLAVSVPNLEDPLHAPERRFHYAHIYNFNHATLKGLLYKAGFTLLEPGNTTTTVVARKSHPSTPHVALSNPKNAEHLWEFLTNQTSVWHYTRARPYRRLLQKSWQYPREWVLSKFYPTHQQLLQQVWQRHS